MVTVCAVTCGGMVSVSVGAYGCGHCFCRGVGVWSQFLQEHVGVDIVSTGTYGCGHRLSRDMGIWLVFLYEHIELGIVSPGPCGRGHCFYRWVWSQFL